MITPRELLDRSPGVSIGRPCARMCPVSEPVTSSPPLAVAIGGRSTLGAVAPYTVPGGRCWRAHSPYCAEVVGGLADGQRGSGTAVPLTVPWTVPFTTGGGETGAGGAAIGGGAGSTVAPVRGW